MPDCPACLKKCLAEDTLACIACMKTYHSGCAGLLPADLTCIKELAKKWKCAGCLQAGRKHRSGSVSGPTKQNDASSSSEASFSQNMFNKLFAELATIKTMQQSIADDVAAIRTSHAQLRADMEVRFAELHSQIKECNTGLTGHDTLLAAHSDAISDMSVKVLKIESDIEALKGVPVTTSHHGSGSARINAAAVDEHLGIDEMMAEFTERQKRARNVIVFGVPESRNDNNAERRIADKDWVDRVFSYLGASPVISSVSRLGTIAENKRRPLKVVLQSDEYVRTVLQKSKNLRGHQEYSNIYVSSDQTPRQQRLYRSVRDQLRERTARGESNLKIRMVSGIPTIVNLN